ncbi:hypothetical protein ABAC402_13390 [Asticcacaulis sp. AC402]|nr:hypothetical protein ABAC402_13390 [Asticcacaulis sp. AC402]
MRLNGAKFEDTSPLLLSTQWGGGVCNFVLDNLAKSVKWGTGQ